jgi:ABC-2 type transport system ATP-binding protein
VLTTNSAVSVRDLVKIFRGPGGEDLRAVDEVSFEVREGEIFGLLGPNGAGKTTTLEIIEGIQVATSGAAIVLGEELPSGLDSIKQRIGVQLQESEYLQHLTLEELLNLFGSFYSKQVDAPELLTSVGLQEKSGEAVSKLSGGQKRRFSLAASLVNDPDVLFLDEPTSGLDPQGRRSVWDRIIAYRETGKTVVITTHFMDEAEVLCDRVGIMDHGKLMALDTPLKLIRSLDSAYHIRFLAGEDGLPDDRFLSVSGAVRMTKRQLPDGTLFDLEIHDPVDSLGDFMKVLSKLGLHPEDIRVEPSTLEDVFLAMTGRELRD